MTSHSLWLKDVTVSETSLNFLNSSFDFLSTKIPNCQSLNDICIKLIQNQNFVSVEIKQYLIWLLYKFCKTVANSIAKKPFKSRSIKVPWHIWRPLHIQNSILVYSNSMWRWRQRCVSNLIMVFPSWFQVNYHQLFPGQLLPMCLRSVSS